MTTKKIQARSKPSPLPDELRWEYRLDYTKAKPNRFAAEMGTETIAVVLDPDVATVFKSSESDNTLLRSVIAALPNGPKANPEGD